MRLELISHAWAGQLEQYAALLNYQLSSLVLYPPENCHIQVTVFHAPTTEDHATARVLDFFLDWQNKTRPENFHFRPWELPVPQLMRRAIGRNMAALRNYADWVWFLDCDMTFHDGCLDNLAEKLATVTTDLAFPREVQKHRHHAAGDALIGAYEAPRILDINPAEFEPVSHDKAIGGLQIARGSRLREIGYCRDVARVQQEEGIWRRTIEDPIFRETIGPATPLEVHGVYRIRHSKAGRDYHQGVIHG